jgi:hypothetical protein
MSKLHPNAVANYNEKAERVASAIEPMPPRPSKTAIPPEKSDAPIMAQFGSTEVKPGSVRQSLHDRTGKVVACYFFVEGKGQVGISGEAHEELWQTAGRLSSDRAYRDSVSQTFFYRKAIDWLQARTSELADLPDLVGYLEAAAAKAVRRFQIWYPIPSAEITRPIQIGRTEFRRITKPMMDEYAERLNASESPKSEAAFARLRSRIQSSTAACVEVEAEPTRADQIARAESEASIAIFRLACPAMLDVYEWAPLDPSFVDGFGGAFNLHVEDKKILAHNSALPQRMCTQWLMQPDEMEHNFGTIWAFGHNLIVIERNDFQELLLGALIHYSKSVLKADPSERLLYVITALESLLIKDSGESILQNLRERLAIMMSPNVDERLAAMDRISRVYDIRSKFVHTAFPVQDLAILAEFIQEAWGTMFFLLNNYDKWANKIDFLRFVDSFKFRGPQMSTETLPKL